MEDTLNLLIVDDEENTRKLIKMIPDWEALNVQVVGEASTGMEALYMIEEQTPDIVLVDIEMPYMDGLTLSRRIMERYSGTEIIILTAHDRFAYAKDALSIGVKDYVLKPVSKDSLETAIAGAARRARERIALLGRMETFLSYEQDTNIANICRQISGLGGGRQAEKPKHLETDERLEDLLAFVKKSAADKAVPLAAEIMELFQAAEDLNAAKVFAVGFLSRATDTLSGLGVPWLDIAAAVTPRYAQIFEKSSVAEVTALINEQVASLCALASAFQSQRSGEIAAKVMRDIDENYSDAEISLSALACKHAVNASYLSRAFKNYAGKSFSDYLVEIRIQRAREILDKCDCKAYQLAQMVGINDPNYFAKCFKKVMGMSFQSYKADVKR